MDVSTRPLSAFVAILQSLDVTVAHFTVLISGKFTTKQSQLNQISKTVSDFRPAFLLSLTYVGNGFDD